MSESSSLPPQVHVVVAPDLQYITPGQQAVYLVSIDNLTNTMQSQAVRLEGLPQHWFRIEMSYVGQAFPGEKRTATIVVTVPREEPPAERRFTVVVLAETVEVRVDCRASVLPAPGTAPAQSPAARPAPPPIAQPPLLTLTPSTFLFRAGQTYAQAMLAVENRSQLVERYVVTVPDEPRGWITLSAMEVRLEPGQRQELVVRLEPRTGAQYPAGEYDVRIRLAPLGFPDIAAEAPAHISIEGRMAFDARLSPLQIAGSKGDYTLALENTGDLPIQFSVEAADTEGLCDFAFDAHPQLAAGEERPYPITVTPRRSGLIGGRKMLSFQVRVRPEDTPSTQTRLLDARLIHKPMIGLLPVLLAVVAVAALAFGLSGVLGGGDGDDADGGSAIQPPVTTAVPGAPTTAPSGVPTLAPAAPGAVLVAMTVSNTTNRNLVEAFASAMPWATLESQVFNQPATPRITFQGQDVAIPTRTDAARANALLRELGLSNPPVYVEIRPTNAELEVWFRSNLGRSGFSFSSDRPAPNTGLIATISVSGQR